MPMITLQGKIPKPIVSILDATREIGTKYQSLFRNVGVSMTGRIPLAMTRKIILLGSQNEQTVFKGSSQAFGTNHS